MDPAVDDDTPEGRRVKRMNRPEFGHAVNPAGALLDCGF
jgi:hypothetical protein